MSCCNDLSNQGTLSHCYDLQSEVATLPDGWSSAAEVLLYTTRGPGYGQGFAHHQEGWTTNCHHQRDQFVCGC